MKDDKLRYIRLGLRNGLFSLIPVFPIISLYPGVLLADQIGSMFNDCEVGYRITLWTCLLTVVIGIVIFFRQESFYRMNSTHEQRERRFNILCAGFYVFVNTALMVIILGTNLACYGDGQSILVCIYSGPLTSLGILLLGFILDLGVRATHSDNGSNALLSEE